MCLSVLFFTKKFKLNLDSNQKWVGEAHKGPGAGHHLMDTVVRPDGEEDLHKDLDLKDLVVAQEDSRDPNTEVGAKALL